MNPSLSIQKRSRPLTAAQQRLRGDIRHLSLWTFQAWLAMAFIAAGYAKLFETMVVVAGLLGWVRPELEVLVRTLGVAEIGLGLSMLVPLVSWKVGRPFVLLGAIGMIVSSSAMIVIDGLEKDIWSIGLNVALIGLSSAVVIGRRRHANAL